MKSVDSVESKVEEEEKRRNTRFKKFDSVVGSLGWDVAEKEESLESG